MIAIGLAGEVVGEEDAGEPGDGGTHREGLHLEAEHGLPGDISHMTNSLGMVFVKVPGTTAQFSIWETRQRDFAAFTQANPEIRESGHARRARDRR